MDSPNVGKSTFLSRVTNVTPKIANYHFTTLNPNLGVVDLGENAGFVIADIPGLIHRGFPGVGLGLEFLRHIERTKVLIHMVDAAGVERDPVEDINAINEELKAYNPELLNKPWVIAANKIDAIYSEDESPLDKIKAEFEPKGIKVLPISAVSGKGVKELLYHVNELLKLVPDGPTVYEADFDPNEFIDDPSEPFTVEKINDGFYSIEGPRIERMLGYTNIEDERRFVFFQNFLKIMVFLNNLKNWVLKKAIL